MHSETELNSNQPDQTKPKKRAWFLRLNLRTLMLTLTLICILFGTWITRWQNQKRAVEYFKTRGFRIVYDYFEGNEQDPFAPQKPKSEHSRFKSFLAKHLGIDSVSSVIQCEVTDDEAMQKAANFPRLKTINIRHEVSDLSSLANLTNLETIYLTSPCVKDLSRLRRLRNLKFLSCESTIETGFESLNRLRQLETLHIGNLPSLDSIKHCSKLKALNIKGIKGIKAPSIDKATIDDLEVLRSFVDLESLEIANCKADDLSPIFVLKKLENVSLPNSKVRDLGPFASCKSLRRLVLNGNQIEDLSPLAELTGLEKLEVRDNPIESIAPLKKLSQLSELHLAGTNVSDLSVLEHLPNVGTIHLSGARLKDRITLGKNSLYELLIKDAPQLLAIDGLENSAKKLNQLCLNNTGVANLDALKNAFRLETVEVKRTPIEDWRWLNDKTIQQLTISDCPLDSLQAVSNLTASSLIILNTKIPDLISLGATNKFWSLSIAGKEFRSLAGVERLEKLRTLKLQNVSLHSMDELSEIQTLRDVSIFDSPINNIGGLTESSRIGYLRIANCPVEDLSPIEDFESLRDLRLINTQVRDITPLLKMIKNGDLHELSISKSPFSDLSPFAKMEGLKIPFLDLSFTDVSDVAPLSNCSIIQLRLNGTQVTDLSPLLETRGLGAVYVPEKISETELKGWKKKFRTEKQTPSMSGPLGSPGRRSHCELLRIENDSD